MWRMSVLPQPTMTSPFWIPAAMAGESSSIRVTQTPTGMLLAWLISLVTLMPLMPR